MMTKYIRPALGTFIALTLLCGVFYPALVTLVAQSIFPEKSNGSMIVRDGKFAGSELIGQPFAAAKYFWSRPSATSPAPYNAAASLASNLGPLNPALTDRVRASADALKKGDATNAPQLPVDLVTTSGSGLDPHISVAAAIWQVPRIARSRNLTAEQLRTLIGSCSEERQLGVLGERRVNVLKLNLALDEFSSHVEVK